jgi:chemotaxis protein methyltransferase CheR
MDDAQFRRFLDHLGLSWQGYRKVRKGVKRRIDRHMHALGCHNLSEYLNKLEKDRALGRACERLMGVSVSRFFRDRRFWSVLEGEILPELTKTCPANIRIWSAGCASGEEVYSLKIVWENFSKTLSHPIRLTVTATDINPDYINRAVVGLYPSSSLREVPESLRASFFRVLGRKNRYAVTSSLKEGIVWRVHHLLSTPPANDFHLVFLRNNLLTYYGSRHRDAAFEMVVASLAANGFLVIGAHEKLPTERSDLIPHGELPYLLKKRESGKC